MVKTISYKQTSEETYWDEIATGAYQHGMTNHRQHILDVIEKYKIQSILDVGCGTGPIYDLLLKERLAKGLIVPSYKGIDYGKKFIQIAKKQFHSGLFEVGDARKLREKRDGYDLVLLMHVLDHVDKWKKVIKEAMKVSKKYVQIILWRPFTDKPDWLWQTVMNDTLFSDTYLHEYRKEDLEAEFERRKLKTLESHEVINEDGKYNYCFLLQK